MPIEDKFGNYLLCKLTTNIRHLQYIIHRFFRLPIRRNRARHRILFHHAAIKLPLAANMLNKLGIPGAGEIAAITPVENKLRDRILDKVGIDATLTNQNLQGIVRGSPLA